MKTASTANGVITTLLDQKGYDPRGRLIKEWHTINGGTPVLVSSITYDIQNRLRKINDPANLGTKPFALELQYHSPNVSGATAQYAGNISAVRWKQAGGSEQTYYYNYDSYSRLTAGVHGGGNSEQSIGYDSNGNINALTRTGVQAAGMGYTYSGNKLTLLTKDGTPYSYAYDSNGNTTTDGLRGMTIAYNYLNLPKTVTKGSDVLTYIYDTAGSKLAEKINTTVNNFYTGAIVYKGDKTIDYIQTSTGIVRKAGADFIRQYNINDHLGNVRAVVNQSGTIGQSTDYYPYSLAFNYNNLDKNRYLYNGKELQNQSLATTFFGVYDYGARFYDPQIGRWHVVDPMAEVASGWSPCRTFYDNPIRYIDPTGMLEDDYGLDKDGNIALLRETDDKTDKLIALDNKGQETDKSVEVEKGVLNNVKTDKDSRGTSYDYMKVGNNETATKLFEFVADNSQVEWSQVKYGTKSNYISTSHTTSESGGVDLMYNLLTTGNTVRENIHSHPYRKSSYYGPSGFHPRDQNSGDRELGEWINKYYPSKGVKLKVYEVPLKKYIQYNHKEIIKQYGNQ